MRGALILLAACGSTPARVLENHGEPAPAAAAPVGAMARVARYSIGWIQLDGDPLKNDVAAAANEVWPVAGATADRVRLRIDRDDARLALWLPRADLQPSITHDLTIAIDGAPHGTDAGVVAHAGAIVRARRGRHATITGNGLVIHGDVGDDAIADTWTPSSFRWPKDDLILEPGEVVRATPDDRGVVLADVGTDTASARTIATSGRWSEIVAGGDLVEVRGYVKARTPVFGSLTGTGVGSGYGMSDTAQVDVPEGACLYDQVGGEAIGVELAARSRYAFGTDDPAWWNVYVETPWGLQTVAYHVGVRCP